jgi:hypothetical protein
MAKSNENFDGNEPRADLMADLEKDLKEFYKGEGALFAPHSLPEEQAPLAGRPLEISVSGQAEKDLAKFELKLAGRSLIFIKELLEKEKGRIDPQMPVSELPAFLEDYIKSLKKG